MDPGLRGLDRQAVNDPAAQARLTLVHARMGEAYFGRSVLLGRLLRRQPSKWHVIAGVSVGMQRGVQIGPTYYTEIANMTWSRCACVFIRFSRPKGVISLRDALSGAPAELAWATSSGDVCKTCEKLHATVEHATLEELRKWYRRYGFEPSPR